MHLACTDHKTFNFFIVCICEVLTTLSISEISRHLCKTQWNWEFNDHCFALGNSHLAVTLFEYIFIHHQWLLWSGILDLKCTNWACEIHTEEHILFSVAIGFLKVSFVHLTVRMVSFTIFSDLSSVPGPQQIHQLDSWYLTGEVAPLAQVLVSLYHVNYVIGAPERCFNGCIFTVTLMVLLEDQT